MTKLQDLIAQLDTLVLAIKAEVAAATAGVIATSDALTSALLHGGTYRLTPGLYTGNFVVGAPLTLTGGRDAVLVPGDLFTPPLTVLASDVTLSGFTVKNGAPDRDTVVVGRFQATRAEDQPSRVTLDGLHVAAGASGGHRGIALHGSDLTVRNCRVTNFWEERRQSQGIWAHNGPGPYTIEHNYVEASGIGILTGGDSIRIPGCVPTDVIIRGNHCFKPEAWKANPEINAVCGIELKNCRKGLIENNLVDGNWKSAQDGWPFVLTARNQYGDTPWVIVDDVIVRGNVTKRCPEGYAVNILGRDTKHPSAQTQRILIEHNLFIDSPQGFLIQNGVAADLTIRRNTLPGIRGNFLAFADSQTPPRVVTPLTFVDNVLRHGEYGLNAGSHAFPAIVTWVAFRGNVIERDPRRMARDIPPGQTWVEPGQLATLLDPVTLKLTSGTAGY